MSTSVVMPQMGESIAEGTVVRWIKKPGDRVDRDEPLFEISTDKVDAEIPSPAAGVLLEIRVQVGETVPVDSVVATIGEPGESPGDVSPAATPASAASAEGTAPAPARSLDAPSAPRQVTAHARGTDAPMPLATGAPAAPAAPAAAGGRTRVSPLVRRMAREHNIDLSRVQGTGLSGRVRKQDIITFLKRRPAGAPPSDATVAKGRPLYEPGDDVTIEPLSIIRRKIAEHMVLSRRTSAHVHTVFHVDFTHVDRLRREHKASYETRGARLTYMTFIARALVAALRRHPIVNASLDGTNVVYKKDVNLGIAVALEGGLIVPVVRRADQLDMPALSRAIVDLAERARTKQLKAEDVQAGTFTITNPGGFGAQFGLPIINQPQVAILGVGTVEKRAVVVGDAVTIRTMAYLTLGFDHRLIDGAAADAFMADLKQGIETFDPAWL